MNARDLAARLRSETSELRHWVTAPAGEVRPANRATARALIKLLLLPDKDSGCWVRRGYLCGVRGTPPEWESADVKADAATLVALVDDIVEVLDEVRPDHLARGTARFEQYTELMGDEAGEALSAFDFGRALAAAEAELIRRRQAKQSEAEGEARRLPTLILPRPASPRPAPKPAGPTETQRAELGEAWALVHEFPGDPDAWVILRRAALAASDDDVAAMAKARAKALRSTRVVA